LLDSTLVTCVVEIRVRNDVQFRAIVAEAGQKWPHRVKTTRYLADAGRAMTAVPCVSRARSTAFDGVAA
jgi:hypothetical protein